MYNKVYHVYSLDNKNVRLKSSSGGVFAELSHLILKKKGIVYGVAYNGVTHTAYYTSTKEIPLEKLQKSKYIAPEVQNIYKEVVKDLKENKMVLFCGLPCHIAGLKNVVKMQCSNMIKNLYLVDFLCEGIPSPNVFQEYLTIQEKKFKSRSTNVDFRSKEYGWAPHCMKIYFQNGKIYVKPYFDDLFMSPFIDDLLFNRDCCYCCRFRENKKADITLGDFWKIKELSSKYSDNLGHSVVFLNTTKGEKLFDQLDDKEIFSEQLSEEQIPLAIQHVETNSKVDAKEKFFSCYLSDGYLRAIKQYSSLGNRKFIKRLKNIKYKIKLEVMRKKMKKENERR